jgi:hypothetical protein
VVFKTSELAPNAALRLPPVFEKRELFPTAVFATPILLVRAFDPIAVLLFPVEFKRRALKPRAVLLFPTLLEASDSKPTPVFEIPETVLLELTG